MELTLDAIGLVVNDIPASLAFYRLLGLDIPTDADASPHVEVTLPGGLRLMWDSPSTVSSFDASWQAPTGGHRIALAFAASSPTALDAAYSEIVAAGYAGHIAPWDAFWGQRYAVIHDPDGNAIELFAASEPAVA